MLVFGGGLIFCAVVASLLHRRAYSRYLGRRSSDRYSLYRGRRPQASGRRGFAITSDLFQGSVMRIVLQRVTRASVTIAGRVAGAIDRGFCILVGFTHSDTAAEVDWMAEKVIGLRLFTDPEGKMNLGLSEVTGSLLVISQFTLYGNSEKGRRPSFIDAARPETAIPLYQRFLAQLRQRGVKVEAGEFGADMLVEIHNDGPVTLIVDRDSARTDVG